jgi:hypothetical protein
MQFNREQPDTPRAEHQPVLRQVGWMFHNIVYTMDSAAVTELMERGETISPLYIQTGVWEDLGDGKWGIKD